MLPKVENNYLGRYMITIGWSKRVLKRILLWH